ncbi:unnamed protein product [Chrysoparadoxa australica]
MGVVLLFLLLISFQPSLAWISLPLSVSTRPGRSLSLRSSIRPQARPSHTCSRGPHRASNAFGSRIDPFSAPGHALGQQAQEMAASEAGPDQGRGEGGDDDTDEGGGSSTNAPRLSQMATFNGEHVISQTKWDDPPLMPESSTSYPQKLPGNHRMKELFHAVKWAYDIVRRDSGDQANQPEASDEEDALAVRELLPEESHDAEDAARSSSKKLVMSLFFKRRVLGLFSRKGVWGRVQSLSGMQEKATGVGGLDPFRRSIEAGAQGGGADMEMDVIGYRRWAEGGGEGVSEAQGRREEPAGLVTGLVKRWRRRRWGLPFSILAPATDTNHQNAAAARNSAIPTAGSSHLPLDEGSSALSEGDEIGPLAWLLALVPAQVMGLVNIGQWKLFIEAQLFPESDAVADPTPTEPPNRFSLITSRLVMLVPAPLRWWDDAHDTNRKPPAAAADIATAGKGVLGTVSGLWGALLSRGEESLTSLMGLEPSELIPGLDEGLGSLATVKKEGVTVNVPFFWDGKPRQGASSGDESLEEEGEVEEGDGWFRFFFPSKEESRPEGGGSPTYRYLGEISNAGRQEPKKGSVTYQGGEKSVLKKSRQVPSQLQWLKQKQADKATEEMEALLGDKQPQQVSDDSVLDIEVDTVTSGQLRRARIQPLDTSNALDAGTSNDTKLLARIKALRRANTMTEKLERSMIQVSIEAGASVNSSDELKQFIDEKGFEVLMKAFDSQSFATKGASAASLRNLLRHGPELAKDMLEHKGFIEKVIGLLGWPIDLKVLAQQTKRSHNHVGVQEEALSLLLALVVASEDVEMRLRAANIRTVLEDIVEKSARQQGMIKLSMPGLRRTPTPASAAAASKLLAALGYNRWKPKQKLQTGLRILCLDGGGTRGVLTLALLKQVMEGVNKEPHEVFDMIVGTSTGGILTIMLGSEKFGLQRTALMYDDLIYKIFSKIPWLSGAKLIFQQAQYSEGSWEEILESLLQDKLMLDSMEDPNTPKMAMCSTIMNMDPPELALWRNYNYEDGLKAKHKGSFRTKIRDALRATTAAPTYFSPLKFDDMLYCDGALLANNPTAVAISEAQLLFPGVPIEAIVSIGTGYFTPERNDPYLNWGTIIGALVFASTDTEGLDAVLRTVLPSSQYFRFNPEIEPFPIDETSPERLATLKHAAAEYFKVPANKQRMQELTRLLRGETAAYYSQYEK